RGDDDDDDDESSDDDEDDDDVEEDEDKEEEEEHPASADSVPPPVHRVTARMSIREQPPTPFWSEAEITRLVDIPSPPPPPLSPWSSPLPQIPSPPLPVSSPVPRQTPLLLPKSLPIPSPPLLLPSTDHRADRPEVCLPHKNRLCIALGLRYEVGESSSAPTARPTGGLRADYGFVGTLDDEIRQDPKRYVELSQRMTDFVTTLRQDTYEIYERLDDAQDDMLLMSGRLNMLHRDRCAHARNALLIKREARLSREAWGQSMDASDTARSEVRALKTTVLAQQTEIAALRAADRARHA
ncbi:hypothetical protein Tco_1471761, partial [Tanacetum coccineum]